MTDPISANAVNRFDGLAGLYDRHRPDYPDAALDHIMTRCRLEPGRIAIDVGCGTGISTRQLAARGLQVIGIEPHAEMRTLAESTPVPAKVRPPRFCDGRAEATGLPDRFADLVIAAQAFHWFRPAESLREFHRILKPGGCAVLMWNEQDQSDPFTLSFREAIRDRSPDPEIASWSQCTTGVHLLTSPLFRESEGAEFPHAQKMDVDQLLGRAFSASFAPKQDEPRRQLADKLRDLFHSHEQGGCVILRYQTTLFLARKS